MSKPNEVALCLHCMTPLEIDDHVCPNCGRSANAAHCVHAAPATDSQTTRGSRPHTGCLQPMAVWTITFVATLFLCRTLLPAAVAPIAFFALMGVLTWRMLAHQISLIRSDNNDEHEEELPPELETDLLTAEALSYDLEEEIDDASEWEPDEPEDRQ
ncbi:hypothetical protein [Mucisphaera calidilacus]|uniref:Uncharacterized protein n=1 Tax=Mucisphaera calidilacus TaxID=2527982 RepID=A0A518C0W1_9BACT|nr:hypothetical protein [Mucisphaera calidilacus]QDU72856.1 hypothetical protein Pan265_27320 [Mucisphaera calidilacus]